MQQPFTTLKLNSIQFLTLETFFVNMHGGGGAENINQQRRKIFCQRSQNPELIPPTQNALFHHCQRALYQASVWVSANVAEMKSPDPLDMAGRSWAKATSGVDVDSRSKRCLSRVDQMRLQASLC